MADGFNIVIDASDLQAEIDRLEKLMTPRQFENAMYGIYRRTGAHVKTILRKDLPKQYQIKAKDISAAVRNAQVTSGAAGAGCTIPVVDRRGKIGGRYKASGGTHGWESLRSKKRVRARIVKSGRSVLPSSMPGAYGGNKPFINLNAPKLNGVAFTRKTKARLPIMPVEGIAIPQMPMTRSEDDVQNDIKEYLERQIEQRMQWLLRSGR